MTTYLRNGIGKYRTKAGDTRWRYMFRHRKILYQHGGFPTERAAKDARDEQREKLRTGTHIQESREAFGSYARNWIEMADIRESTRAMYLDHLGRYLKPLHNRPLQDIRPEEIRVWEHSLRTRKTNRTDSGYLAESTVHRCYSLARRVFSVAEKEGKIHRSPCVLDNRQPQKLRDTPLFTPQEILALADHVAAEYRALVLVSAFGGLRFSEAIGLRPTDIDLRNGTVRVARTFVEQLDGVITESELTKSAAGTRTVPLLSPLAVEALRLRVNQTPKATDLLFPGAEGKVWRRVYFYRRVWNPALRRANLTRQRFTFHHLRHYALTLLGNSGATLQELKEWGGHSSVSAVMIYQHTDRNHLESVVQNAAARVVEATGAVPFHRRPAAS